MHAAFGPGLREDSVRTGLALIAAAWLAASTYPAGAKGGPHGGGAWRQGKDAGEAARCPPTGDDRCDVRLRLGDEPRRSPPLRGACAEAAGWRRPARAALQGRGTPCDALGMRPALLRRVRRPGERVQRRDVRQRRRRGLRGRWRLRRALSNRPLGRAVPGRGRGGSCSCRLLCGVWVAERRLRGRDALASRGASAIWLVPPGAIFMTERHVR